MPTELTEKEKVKLAIIATEEIPENFMEQMLLALTIENKDDLEEIFGCLAKHRPELAKRYARLIMKQPKPSTE